VGARLLVGLVLLAVVIAPAATGVPSVVAAVADITGPDADGYMTLTVRNTGTEPILCFALLVPSAVKVVGAEDISPEWRLIASRPVPTPDIGARSPNGPGIPPGGSVRLRFRTDPAYPANGDARLIVSASPNCTPVVEAPVTGPPPPPPPPPKPKPVPKKCECDDVGATVRRVFIGQFEFSMTVDWVLTCKGDNGVRCQGELKGFGWVGNDQIKVLRPAPKKAKKGQPANPVIVTCKGKCAKKPSKGSVRVSGSTKTNSFRTKVRAGQGYTFVFSSFCDDRKRGSYRVYVKFDAKGRIDKKKSDLNGNGKIDSEEAKRR
jgi:hypothetical protein